MRATVNAAAAGAQDRSLRVYRFGCEAFLRNAAGYCPRFKIWMLQRNPCASGAGRQPGPAPVNCPATYLRGILSLAA